ncbi:unnamed protein product, partial [Rotaria sp. Silwood1]
MKIFPDLFEMDDFGEEDEQNPLNVVGTIHEQENCAANVQEDFNALFNFQPSFSECNEEDEDEEQIFYAKWTLTNIVPIVNNDHHTEFQVNGEDEILSHGLHSSPMEHDLTMPSTMSTPQSEFNITTSV